MAKFSFGEGGFQGFMARHVEKIVFGGVVLTFLGLVWFGISRESFPKSADQLAKDAEAAVTNVTNTNSWSQIGEQYQAKSSYKEKIPELRRKTAETDYTLPTSWAPVDAKSRARRNDPKLLAPRAPELVALTGAIALKPSEEEDEKTPWDDDKPFVVKEEVKKVVKKKVTKKPKGGKMSSMGMGMGMSGSEAATSMTTGMGMSMSMGSEMMSGMFGTGASSLAQGVKGYRPGSPAQAREVSLVAVKFLAPMEDQLAEYEKEFLNAVGHEPMRDRPRYIFFRAQRADVTDDPDKELKDEDWDPKWKMNPKLFPQIWADWHGTPVEPNDPRYLEMNLLTMPIPPILMEDTDPLAVHSEIPLNQATPELSPDEQESEEKDVMDEDDLPGGLPVATPSGVGMAGIGLPGTGAGARGMPYGPGAAGMPGMPMGQPGAASMGMGQSGAASMGMGQSGAASMGMGQSGAASMSMGMGQSGAASMGMGGYMGMGADGGYAANVVKYKLIRFFDFEAKPGRKYRYRVQLVLEDPNHPEALELEPSKRTLSDTVLQRLKATLDQETKNPKARRVFYLDTPWSPPSDVVSVDLPSKVLAGTVTPPKPVMVPTLGELTISEPKAEVKGQVMTLAWEPKRAVKVPGVKDVFRGTYLNFSTEVNVAHPVTLDFRTIKEFPFSVNSLVVDMRGGETIPGSDKDKPLNVPAEMILMDANGNLIVRNELEDLTEFKSYLPPEIEKPPTQSSSSMGDDMPGILDYGDMGPKKKKK